MLLLTKEMIFTSISFSVLSSKIQVKFIYKGFSFHFIFQIKEGMEKERQGRGEEKER